MQFTHTHTHTHIYIYIYSPHHITSATTLTKTAILKMEAVCSSDYLPSLFPPATKNPRLSILSHLIDWLYPLQVSTFLTYTVTVLYIVYQRTVISTQKHVRNELNTTTVHRQSTKPRPINYETVTWFWMEVMRSVRELSEQSSYYLC